MLIKKIEVKNILSNTKLPVSDFVSNPYVGCSHACKYCYASFMKRFTNYHEPWGDFVDVKYWDKIKNKEKYSGKELFLCSVTDPYQPIEAKFQRTRAILEEFKGSNIKLSISTKSDLILRDLDLIKTFPETNISWSINTLDENFRKQMDNAVSIERRLSAMKKFYDDGIRTTCFISPIFPYITNVKNIIERVKNQCNMIWLENLNLRADYKNIILSFIHKNYPELDSLYHDMYVRKDKEYWILLDKKISEYALKNRMLYIRNKSSKCSNFGELPIIHNYFYHEEIKKL